MLKRRQSALHAKEMYEINSAKIKKSLEKSQIVDEINAMAKSYQTTLAVSEVNEAVQKQADIILSINALTRQFKTT